MEKIYTDEKALRALNDKTIYVKGVYFPYYHGYDEASNKFRHFVRFPIIPDDIVEQGDERNKPKTAGEKMEFREKVWLDGRFCFKKFTGKVNKDFFKLFPKKFDVAVEVNEPIEVSVWDKASKSNVLKPSDNLVIPMKASKIKKALEDLELDSHVVLVDGTDKLGKPAKVMPFDYEDAIRGELVGKFIRVKVKGESIDTRYTFKEGDEFAISEEAQEDALKSALASQGKGNTRSPDSQGDISLMDVPF